MIKNRIRELWREDKTAIGTWIALGSPIAAEILARMGFDWVLIDSEHSSIDIETVQSIVQAISGTRTAPIVRVPWNDPMSIKRTLDAGAFGIMVPMVNTREDAIRAVEASRYPPRGIRSVGGPRFRLYGGADYFEHSSEEILVIVQIEHINAVNNIDEIISVDGVDAFFIGPNDLAASMNIKLGIDNKDPKHVKAVADALAAGKKHGVPAGILVGNSEAAKQRVDEGFRLVAISSDEGFLMSAAYNNLKPWL